MDSKVRSNYNEGTEGREMNYVQACDIYWIYFSWG